MSLHLAKSLAQILLTRKPATGFHSLTTVSSEPSLLGSLDYGWHFVKVSSPGRKSCSLMLLEKKWPALIVILCLLRGKLIMLTWDFLQRSRALVGEPTVSSLSILKSYTLSISYFLFLMNISSTSNLVLWCLSFSYLDSWHIFHLPKTAQAVVLLKNCSVKGRLLRWSKLLMSVPDSPRHNAEQNLACTWQNCSWHCE